MLARVISPVNHDGIRDTMLHKLDMHDSSLALIDAPVYIDEDDAHHDSVTVADDCVQTLRRLYVPALTISRLTAACMLVAIPLGTEVHAAVTEEASEAEALMLRTDKRKRDDPELRETSSTEAAGPPAAPSSAQKPRVGMGPKEMAGDDIFEEVRMGLGYAPAKPDFGI